MPEIEGFEAVSGLEGEFLLWSFLPQNHGRMGIDFEFGSKSVDRTELLVQKKWQKFRWVVKSGTRNKKLEIEGPIRKIPP